MYRGDRLYFDHKEKERDNIPSLRTEDALEEHVDIEELKRNQRIHMAEVRVLVVDGMLREKAHVWILLWIVMISSLI